MKYLIGCLICCCIACQQESREQIPASTPQLESELEFDVAKWRAKEGNTYTYRKNMVNGILYNDTFRTYDKSRILELLGTPDKINEEYLYYTITRNRMGIMTLNTTTMVIKFAETDTVDWIKIHE